MKKEWFEPGPDGESPFTREFYRAWFAGVDTGVAISAAFRALLAGEDVGRTADAKDAEIAELRAEVERLESKYHDKSEWCNRWQGVITEERQKNALLTAEVARLNDVVIKMQRPAGPHGSEDDVERERLRILNNDLEATCAHLQAERDALRTRIDAGEVVYDGPSGWWCTEGPYSKIKALIIDREIIDARPIEQPDHIADPGKMVDDRTGKADRRGRQKGSGAEWRRLDKRDSLELRSCRGCRRRTAGTIADRGKAS